MIACNSSENGSRHNDDQMLTHVALHRWEAEGGALADT